MKRRDRPPLLLRRLAARRTVQLGLRLCQAPVHVAQKRHRRPCRLQTGQQRVLQAVAMLNTQ
jgi:hypothetical protein